MVRRGWVRTERGAVSVEAALITPILILLIFGTLEFGLVLKDWLAVSSAIRAGARVASAEPKQLTYATDAAARVAAEDAALDATTIAYLWVYEPQEDGTPQMSGNICTRCVRFAWNQTARRFDQKASSWLASEQNACLGDPTRDSIGVQMQIRHPAVTKLFFTSYTITEKAVLGLEPVSTAEQCQ